MKKLFLLTLVLVSAIQPSRLNAQKPLSYRDTTIRGPQTFAMLIGISKYRYIRPLNFADKDAMLFGDFLKSPGGGRVKNDNIFQLMNDDATSGNFWSKGFQWLKAKKLQKGDRLFIYLAGHGDAIDEDQFFFLAFDCNPGSDKDNYLVGGAIQLYNLKKKIANETAKGVDVFFIMDACRTNELPGGSAGQNFLNMAVSQKKAGEIMMLATAAGQESLEDASIGNGHGLFTYYLVDGLSGVADTDGTPDNKVTFSEIRNYVDKYVPSIAQQRFKKDQVPYFCCNENSDKIISVVDPAYLKKWLQEQKAVNRGGGNSFNDVGGESGRIIADTLLIQTYNRFYKAIKDNNLSGSSSAEFYYGQLDKKFPNNPYTLDAKSTLAAEFINDAQRRVNDYISCMIPSTSRDKQGAADAGNRLEKAIAILNEDEPEFATSLRGRMNLLRSMGDYGNSSTAFTYAYAAKAIDPKAAYINAWLARLHLANNNPDSAAYYADKATKAAPNWACALTTLALVQQALANRPVDNKQPPKKVLPRSSFGFTLGGGINQSDPSFQTNNSNIIETNSRSAGTLDIGVIYHIPIGKNVSVRPAILFFFGNTEMDFVRRGVTGGPITEHFLLIKSSAIASLPLLIHFNDKKVSPYLMLAPAFSYILAEGNPELLPLKKSFFLADAGLGIDFRLPKTGIVLSPELKYSAGLSDMKDAAGTTDYSRSLSSLKKQGFTLNVYLRMR